MMFFKNFTIREFTNYNSNDERKQLIDTDYLFDNLVSCMHTAQHIRSIIGSPIIISSAYRDKRHNEMVGGSKTSQHITASAFDIKLTSAQKSRFFQRLEDIRVLNIGQLIEYDWGFHVGLSHANNEKVRPFQYINKLKS